VWPLEYQKKFTNFQKILKKHHTGEFLLKKRYNFAAGASNHTFVLTHPVYLQNVFLFIFTKPSPLYIFTKPSPLYIFTKPSSFYFYKTFFSLYLY